MVRLVGTMNFVHAYFIHLKMDLWIIVTVTIVNIMESGVVDSNSGVIFPTGGVKTTTMQLVPA